MQMRIYLPSVVLAFSFICCNKESPIDYPLTKITITTTPVDSITKNSALAGGTIVISGFPQIKATGVCWNTTTNPTAAMETKTNIGESYGVFSSTIFGLQPGTTYYTRAYIIADFDTLYGQQITFTTKVKDTGLSLGQKYAGGLIFYLDGSNEHGLVCSPFDIDTAKWGCEFLSIAGTSAGLGAGAINSQLIVNGCSEVKFNAKICDSVVLNFYDDWYMPSIDELRLMYLNVYLLGKGNFNSIYHSSTQYDNSSAYAISFKSGSGTPYNLWKGANTTVRPIRAF